MDLTHVVDDDDIEAAQAVGEKPERRSEVGVLAGVAIVLALVLKTFLVQAFFIPSGSMEATLHGCTGCQGDRVLVNKVVYKFRDIHRGEIVVFNGKGTSFTSEASIPPPRNGLQRVVRDLQRWVGFGAPGDRDFIKRVIGLPGDVVACCSHNHVTVNGHEMAEPYAYMTIDEGADAGKVIPLDGSGKQQMVFDPVTVPPGQLFLMGDHRDGSSDSRFNGPVPESKVVGRAFAVFFPFKRAKVLWVPHAFDPSRTSAGALPESPAAPPVLALLGVVPVAVVRRRVRHRGRTD